MAAAAAAAKEGSPYEGGTGAGGKFRKRPFRRLHSTPYDRPPTAFRNPSGTTNNGWFSKFVDPASKLISASAHRFFSSVFRKRLPPPAQPSQSLSEAKKESWANLGEAVSTNPFGAQERTINEGDNPSNNFDSSRFAELEQILKQKTFTRSEIERLTALLHSRTVDMTIPTVEGRSEANHLERAASQNREEEHPNTKVQENGFESHKLLGITSTPNARSRVLEDDVASPAELAKAYMGSRPSKVSPSMLGLCSQAFREDSPTLRNLPFRSKSPITSLVPKSSVHVGVPENGFITPKSRGRSAIYSMARTPYSRIHLSTCHKGSGFTHDAYAGPSSSQFALEQSRNSCSKQAALKRRSSVLDHSIGSVGPIRRIRQRPNLSSSKNLSLPASEIALSVDGSGAVPKLQTECADNSIPGTSFGSVPSHSSEMAQKILQQLHTLVPDSKEKLSDTKLVTAREKSPSRLTPNMLSGQASLENVDSSKCLESTRDTKFDGLLSTCLLDSRDSTSLKQDSPEENGASRFMDLRAAAVNGFGTEVLNKHASRTVKTDESGITYPVAHPPQKKRAFQMSAHEDCLDLDDDGYSNGTTSTPLAESRENLDTSLVESKTVAAEAVAFSEFKLPASSSLNKRTELETSDGVVVAGKSTGFTFPVAPATSMISQPALHALQSSTQSDDVFSRNERNVALPVSSFSSRHMDETTPFSFSSSMSASECSVLKPDDSSDTKAEAFVSLDAVVAGATNTVPETADPDKGDNNNFFTTPKTEISSSPALSVGIFSCVDTPAWPSVVNGSISSSPCIISYPTPILNSSNVSDQTIFSTVTTITTSSSDVSNSSAAAAAAAAASVFKFGSSVSPSTSESVTCVVEVTPDSLVKNKQESVFANLSSKPFGGTGSGFFGFSASATSTATNLSQGTGMGSSVGRNSTQSMPIQFPASSPTFGLSGSANFASGGGSLNSASTFGGGSLTSSSGANSSAAAAAAATTSFSWQQPSTSPTYTATPSFTSMAPSSGSGFTFAAASVSSTNTTSPLVFGSTGTGSPFSFSSPAVNGTLSSAVRSPIFGNPNMFGNNDQMSMEDSMAEDNTQAVAASMNPFGFASQPAPSGFMYNSSATPFQSTAAAPTANSFQFASQQSLNTPSQFQASSSLGSFSLGAGGGDKSNRKMIKVVRKGNRKK